MTNEAILDVRGLSKTYGAGQSALTVLDDVTFTLAAGTTCAILGPSGSGKTTLLGLCAGLDRPSSGSVVLGGHALHTVTEDERARIRSILVGFVFQNFQLIPTLTALENVMVPLELQGNGQARARSRGMGLLDQVGLGDRLHHYPVQLSGGEQQRVAIARAFVNRPRILFADEPTGNLDDETAAAVIDSLFGLNEQSGTALVLVTHDLELAQRAHRLLRLKRGQLVRPQEDLKGAGAGEG